jgi:hypothetical protein
MLTEHHPRTAMLTGKVNIAVFAAFSIVIDIGLHPSAVFKPICGP